MVAGFNIPSPIPVPLYTVKQAVLISCRATVTKRFLFFKWSTRLNPVTEFMTNTTTIKEHEYAVMKCPWCGHDVLLPQFKKDENISSKGEMPMMAASSEVRYSDVDNVRISANESRSYSHKAYALYTLILHEHAVVNK